MGVGLSHLTKDKEIQRDLFQLDEKKKEKVEVVLDKIQDKYGDGTVSRAALLKRRKSRKS